MKTLAAIAAVLALCAGPALAQQQVQGTSAAGAADDGSNPVKTGGVFTSAFPTITNGQRGNLVLSSRGALHVAPCTGDEGASQQANCADIAGGGDAAVVTYLGLVTVDRAQLFNGSTYDRAFTCANTATVSVTAGSTTQIVALSGSTVTRICSIAISMSAAGSAGVYTGTGTNCGTGTTALIQDMTLPTGTPLALSAPEGGSLVRSSAGGEICVKAVTGNVTGFISYAQY